MSAAFVALLETSTGYEVASSGAGLLIVGARSRSAVTRVYEELVRINNDQATALRAALKDVSLQMRDQEERDSRHYDELSRLNNDLATTQRELAKSNVLLPRAVALVGALQ